jgi:hypothetical protein
MRPDDETNRRTGHPAARRPLDGNEGTASIADRGDDSADPRAIGDLLTTWIGLKVDEVDDLVADARDKAAALPDQRQLWLLFGEALVRLHCLELEVAGLRVEVDRLRQRGRRVA